MPETPPADGYLEGGRPGAIRKSGDTVLRPAGPWSEAVQALLAHLDAKGFHDAPRPLGFDDEGREILSFVDGVVLNPQPSGFYKSDDILVAAARLLRRYHDAAASFPRTSGLVWMHAAKLGADTICHGDFAPYNVALRNGLPAGIIDFDVAHPAPRLWDLAYALYRWVPCGDPALSPERAPPAIQIGRMRLFLNAYGWKSEDRRHVVGAILDRLADLTCYMRQRATDGDEKFRADIARGDLALYLRDIEWLKVNASTIAHAL